MQLSACISLLSSAAILLKVETFCSFCHQLKSTLIMDSIFNVLHSVCPPSFLGCCSLALLACILGFQSSDPSRLSKGKVRVREHACALVYVPTCVCLHASMGAPSDWCFCGACPCSRHACSGTMRDLVRKVWWGCEQRDT